MGADPLQLTDLAKVGNAEILDGEKSQVGDTCALERGYEFGQILFTRPPRHVVAQDGFALRWA